MISEYIWQFIKYPLILISLNIFQQHNKQYNRIVKEVNHEITITITITIKFIRQKKEENIHLIVLREYHLIKHIKSQLKYHSPVGNNKLATCKCIAGKRKK